MPDQTYVSEFIKNQEFVTFDTETTGLWAATHRIVELGAVKFRLGDKNEEHFQSLINPEREIPPEVIKIHGITTEMVADAPTADSVLKEFQSFCGDDSILIAHNAPFDISFVATESDRAGMKQLPNAVLDSIDVMGRYHPGLGSYSLLSLARHFKLIDHQNHRALADAICVRKLISVCADQLSTLENLEELCKLFTPLHFVEWQGSIKKMPRKFAALKDAALSKTRVTIHYQNNSSLSRERTVQPRRFYGLGSRLYMSAYCEMRKAERTFRLDRIEKFEILDD